MPDIRPLVGFVLFFPAFQLAALSLDEALLASRATIEAQSAQVRTQSAAALEAIASHSGDPAIVMEPGFRRVTPDIFGVPQQSALDIALTLSLPLGLTKEGRDKALFAVEELTFRTDELDWTLEALRLKAYSLYVAAWEAQEESLFLVRETSISEEEFAAAQNLFKSGSLTYADFRTAEEKVTRTRSAELYGLMNERVRRRELFSWLGIEDDGQALGMTAPMAADLPRGPDLAVLALERDPALKDSSARIILIEEQARGASKVSPALTVKLAAAKDGQTGSLSFGTETRKLGASYDAPLVYLEGSSATTPWTLSASLSIGLATGGEANREASSLRLAAETERLRRESAASSLSLSVHQAFQAWKRADDARIQAERAVTLATEILATVQARSTGGQATILDLSQARLTADRTVFKALVAAIDSERLRRSAALSARHHIE